MSTENKRPYGMSQLDYLWVTFGDVSVQNSASETPKDNVLLTEKALTSLIQKTTGGGITDLTFEDDPTDVTMCRLSGKTVDGSTITVVKIPKEIHVVAFVGRKITQEDVDKGCEYAIGSKALILTLSNGKELIVSMDELNLAIYGCETNTIINEISDKNIIQSNLKIDKGNDTLSVVKLKTTSSGLYSNLEVSPRDSGVVLTKESDGLMASIPLGTTGYNIKFQNLTLAKYMSIESVDSGTVYFITDKPYIYLGSKRYGSNIEPGDSSIISFVYDPDTMSITYKYSDGSDAKVAFLGPVSDSKNGMLSTSQYAEIKSFKNALDGIVNVKDYISTQFSKAAIKLEWGNKIGTSKQLLLKNSNGDILSTITIDTENFLECATSKVADATDVAEAAKQGVVIKEGQQVLILTMTSGDKIYVNLQGLVQVYTGGNTSSINVSVSSSNVISADVNISSKDKMLYTYNDGISSNLQIVREAGKVTMYGRTQTDSDKIGEFVIGDPLTNTIIVKSYTTDTYKNYPPRNVDGKTYDELTNPLIVGDPYLILSFNIDTGSTFTNYVYNDYLSLKPILSSLNISTEKGNMLERDENGYLYCSLKWIDV